MHQTASIPAPPSEAVALEGGLSPAFPPRRGLLARLVSPFRHPLRSLGILLLLALILGGIGLGGVSLWAAYHLRCARVAMERFHTGEAVTHLNKCLRIWPNNSEALLLAARAARRAGRYNDADRCLDAYQQQLGKDSKTDDALLLERVCVRAERGDVEGVFQFCTKKIAEGDPDCPLIWEALARGFLRSYRPVEAEGVLKEWMSNQPDSIPALFIRAQINDLLLRQHETIADYRRILEMDPELDEARVHLAAAQMQMGMSHEALPHMEYLNKRLPGNSQLQVHLARALSETGRVPEAEALLDEVLTRDKRFAPALSLAGKLALQAQRYEQAETLLRQAAALEPSDYMAQIKLYECLEKRGKPEEARKAHAAAEQIKKDMERIQTISTHDMQLNPHSAALCYEAGTIALRAGATEMGVGWLLRALKEDPNHKDSHKALMEHFQRIGDHQQAAFHRSKAGISEPRP